MLTFYRCVLCRKVVSRWDIETEHACTRCGGRKVSPSNLAWWEKVIQIIKHPMVWKWPDDPPLLKPQFPGEAPFVPEEWDDE